MRTRMTKLIGLGVVLVAMALLLVNTPVQAHWPTPATDQLSQNAPAHPQPPPVEAAIQQPALPAAQASPTFDLCASDGEITLPDSTTVTVWGFVDTDGGSCTTGLVNSLPGPELHVNDGDTVTINLTNALAENVSILIPGQNVTESGGVAGLFAAEAAANGGTVSYNFTAQEGAYLYESGTNPSIQIPMGLYGALIVDSGVTGQAYGNAFDQEAVLLLSEIDPNLNANPGNFNLLNYHPTYWLINGAAYPDVPAIVANPGERVLLRYLNAGFDHPSMTLLGGYQRVIAKEGFKLNHSFDAVAETIPAGATADMIVNTAGLQGNLALYNRNMYVTNGDAYPGGMLTFLNLSAPTGMPPMADMVAPVNDAIITGNMVLVQIDASDVEDDANLGAGNLSVNWDVDGGTPQMAVYNGVSGYYEATLDTTALNDGAHIINASVTDSDNNIVYVSNNVNVDNGAPVDNPPTVNAGVDQSIILPDAATLDGTVTDDGLSTLITAWSMTSGPGIVTFGDASLVDTTASFSVDGVYVLRLTATDDTGPVFDEVTVTVNPVPVDQPPTVDAGVDQAITLPDAATLDGTVTDDGLSPLTTQWSMTSGPGTVTFGDASLVDTTASFSVNGDYVLRLTATDDTGPVFDEVTVTVNPVPVDQPPTVNAGVDQTVLLPDSATLDGTVTDDGLSPLTTQWSMTSGPGTATFGDASLVDTTASFSVNGDYVLRLTATDDTGSVFDEVTVTVNPAPEITTHIGDLDDASTPAGGPNWNAQVVITVHAVDESLVNGATVTVNATRIRKSNGSQPVSTLTCVTAAGQCTVTQSVNSNQFENNVTFTVIDVVSPTTYDSGYNHDPDGDSDGTTIVVANPG